MGTNGSDPVEQTPVNLLLGVPSRGQVRIEWASQLASLAMPFNHTHMLQVVTGQKVEDARNTLVESALRHNAQYILFLDDDVLAPDQTVRRMLYQMEQNPEWDLLSGIVTAKTQLAEPCIFGPKQAGPMWDWTFGTQFEIQACGMALCMIRMDVFREKVKEPWFTWNSEMGVGEVREEGEDIGFCRKLREAGGKLMADGGILAGHIDFKTGTVFALDENSAPIKNASEKQLAGHTFYEASRDGPGAEPR